MRRGTFWIFSKRRGETPGNAEKRDKAQNGGMGVSEGGKIVVSTRNDHEMGRTQTKVGSEDRAWIGRRRENPGRNRQIEEGIHRDHAGRRQRCVLRRSRSHSRGTHYSFRSPRFLNGCVVFCAPPHESMAFAIHCVLGVLEVGCFSSRALVLSFPLSTTTSFMTFISTLRM